MGRAVQNLDLPQRIVSADAENGVRGAVRHPGQLTLDVLGAPSTASSVVRSPGGSSWIFSSEIVLSMVAIALLLWSLVRLTRKLGRPRWFFLCGPVNTRISAHTRVLSDVSESRSYVLLTHISSQS